MRSMIYYPGFEVHDEEWLKFALLYFEELRPIIPYMCASNEEYLSPTAIQIMDQTNLIRPYRPEYEEGCCASVLACDEFDKFLRNPERYGAMFNKYRTTAPIERWKDPKFHTCNLYDGKFSDIFYDYCIENKLAHPFNNGIKISKDLAFVYMSLLADIVSKRNEMEMFTDIRKYDSFLLYNDQCTSINQNIKYETIKSQIEFLIPAKIKDIPMDAIIQLRKDRHFDFCRRAYVQEMEKYMDRREKNLNYSFEEQLKIKKELQEILEVTCNVTASVFLSCTTVASLMNGVASPAQALASAYLDFSAIKQVYGLPKYVSSMGRKMQAKRYVGHISKVYRS